jgi:aerobic carbon-monoxide dehydrogenase small subunit
VITLTVNGREHSLEPKTGDSLADALRDELGLIGCRVSCAEGECGSCTTLVDDQPVTACLMLAHQADGRRVVTIEGLGTRDQLHPIQEAFIEEQGFQCGFCTPGFIISTLAFLAENPNPTEEEASVAMSGSICRCGAYPYIVRSVMRAAEKMEASA